MRRSTQFDAVDAGQDRSAGADRDELAAGVTEFKRRGRSAGVAVQVHAYRGCR
jgi:hypothetical protein